LLPIGLTTLLRRALLWALLLLRAVTLLLLPWLLIIATALVVATLIRLARPAVRFFIAIVVITVAAALIQTG
jgi:hypothetical protein